MPELPAMPWFLEDMQESSYFWEEVVQEEDNTNEEQEKLLRQLCKSIHPNPQLEQSMIKGLAHSLAWPSLFGYLLNML